jgi:glycosyltransferase involved in cell wall biosynthesis
LSVGEDMRKKILTLSDHPLSPSGVGTQTRYVIESLLRTGDYRVVSLAGAIKHANYQPVKTEEFGDDWVIHPVDGYGTADLVRSIIRTEKIDMVWIMTDPRFWDWLWGIDDEIRAVCPIVYYHVWDNYPYPTYNKKHYLSNDAIATISKVTDDIVATVAPEVKRKYIPHAVNSDVFKPIDKTTVAHNKKKMGQEDKFVFFWNNRNARRKQSGSLLFWYKDLLERIGNDKTTLIMHTDTKDQHGQDLEAIINSLGMTNGEVKFSKEKLPAEHLALMYNIADCTINVSDAEGFGLATLESLSCGTPIIATMTGGLQEQVTDGKQFFGIGLEPASKAIIGSQGIPWIYEDRLNGKDVTDAMQKMVEMSAEEREELGRLGREHVLKNYNFENFTKSWVDFVSEVVKENGSWDDRRNHSPWTLKEIR